jgi:DNA-binding MarR family transcriptional regulator
MSDTTREPSFPVLLRFARDAYIKAIRAAHASIGCDDLPRNGTYVIGAIAHFQAPLSDIIEQLGMSKQAAGQLVDTLVLRGFLRRTPDEQDRRRLNLSLTERGQAVADATRAAISQMDAALTARAGAEAVSQTKATLAALPHLEAGATPALPPVQKQFARQRFDNASFQSCAMPGVSFTDINMKDATFANVALQGSKITDANLSHVTIDNANIEGLTIFGFNIKTLIEAETKRRP